MHAPRSPRVRRLDLSALLSVARAVSVTLIVTLVAVACGGDTRDDASPGYRAGPGGREVDRSPFTLARPSTTDGPTTLPSSTDGIGSDSLSESSTTTPSTSTTTPLPIEPALPEVAAITSLCGFEAAVGSFNGLNFRDPAEAEELLGRLPEVLSIYEGVAPPAAQRDLAAMRPLIEGFRDVAAANSWDVTSAEVEQALAELVAGPVPDQFERIVEAERSACP